MTASKTTTIMPIKLIIIVLRIFLILTPNNQKQTPKIPIKKTYFYN